MGSLSPATPQVSAAHRWVADPLGLLGVVAAAALVLLMGVGSAGLPWQVPALFGVVAAGLALSGST